MGKDKTKEEVEYIQYDPGIKPGKAEIYVHIDGDPSTLEYHLKTIIFYYTPLLEVFKPGGIIESTEDLPEEKKEEYRQIYSKVKEIRDSWIEAEKDYLSPDTPEERKKEIAYSVEEWELNLSLLHSTNPGYPNQEGEVKLPDYRIVVDPETGERRESREETHLWGDKYFIPGRGILSHHPEGSRDLLADLDNIRKSSKSGVVKVSKDLWKSQIQSPGDSLEFIKDEKARRRIQKKAEEGKYLTGTLVGLTGGSAYFKVFCLAIAQTLNEQSKYFQTESDLSGVPKDLLSQYAGEGVIVDKIKDPSTKLKGGERPYPIVLFIWEDLAKKMSPTGEVSGGKDIKVVRDYVQGGITKRKDKTGKETKTYIPGLLGREYLVEGANGVIVGVPFMTKILSLYSKDSPEKEIGIAVQLSPLFTLKNLIGYTGIRTDTIQLLGGGRQRELTLNLFIFLAYYRGVPAQSGRKKGEFVQRKTELLQDISKGLSSYTGRPGLLEKHYQEAVRKCIDAKILLPGNTKTGGLRGYREEINPGGQKLSIFTYNPDYLKGEEINLFSEVDTQ